MPAQSQPLRVEPLEVLTGGHVRPQRRRLWLAGPAGALAGDRRLVVLAAVVAAVAAFASLVSEWQLVTLDSVMFTESIGGGTNAIPAGFSDLGPWGVGYVVGLFALASATVLVLFGPAAGRGYARLAGLSTGGVLAALLLALAATLRSRSPALGAVFVSQLGAEHVHVAYGRGIWCALAGVAAAVVALALAGRVA
jgi:hypothetical protein